jgi:hypothetical protein
VWIGIVCNACNTCTYSCLLSKEISKVRVGVTSKKQECELFAILGRKVSFCHLRLVQSLPRADVLSAATVRVDARTSLRLTSSLFSFNSRMLSLYLGYMCTLHANATRRRRSFPDKATGDHNHILQSPLTSSIFHLVWSDDLV